MKWGGLLIGLLPCAALALGQDDPEYALGKLGEPPVTEPAEPLRLVDLRFGFAQTGSTVSSFETRLKFGASAFFGGEVRGERFGAFFDTQRVELGVTEEEGLLALEGSYRSRLFLAGIDAEKRVDDTWNLAGDGSVRLSSDWEILLSYRHDTDNSRGGPPSLKEFIDTGRLPPPARPNRVLRSGSVGFLYQRENDLELRGDASVSRIRTEAGFDQTRSRLGSSGVWNIADIELDGTFHVDRITQRLGRTEALAELGVTIRMAGNFVVTGRTLQQWQPGVERFVRDYRGALTFFGRRFRFARQSEAAAEVLQLVGRANELGYNERRVYDVESLRALRERLSISPARADLAEAVKTLYLAQVRERNVPQLGFEFATTTDEAAGSETDTYRIFVGVPWCLAWPFTHSKERVEFLRIDWVLGDERFPSIAWATRSHELTVSAELNRQHTLRVRWERPG